MNQLNLFEVEKCHDNFSDENKIKKTSLKKISNGTKDSVSRYTALQKYLDDDEITNGNWEEIDTLNIDRAKLNCNFIDLFAGTGGISIGFKKAGFNKLLSVEIDNDASNTLRNNFPEAIHFEKPIQEITFEEIDQALSGRKVHIVCGGPPCQGFSVAGLRKPNDPRNQLFKEYIRIVKHLNPYFVFIENVPGILTMQGGEVYQEILKQFADIGYKDMTVRILEAATYGVPQLRTRAIFIGNRLGIKNPYPKAIYGKDNYKTIESAIDDLIDLPFDPSWNHEGTKHSKDMEKRLSLIPPGGSLYSTFRDAWKRQYCGVPCMTIKENHGGVHVHYQLNRVLTAREMARLQTFPDDYIFSGTFKRAYWQIGNAVPPLLAEHIALAIKSKLLNIKI